MFHVAPHWSSSSTPSADQIARQFGLTPGSLVVELGSGDGAFLAAFRQLSLRALGLETNIVLNSRALLRGVDTLKTNWSHETARYIRTRYGLAQVIIVRQQSLFESQQFIAGASQCLAPNGWILGPTCASVSARYGSAA